MKDGGENAVYRELLASQICRCFHVSQVLYEPDFFDGEIVSVSENITSKEFSIASMESLEIYSQNHNRDTKKYILALGNKAGILGYSIAVDESVDFGALTPLHMHSLTNAALICILN